MNPIELDAVPPPEKRALATPGLATERDIAPDRVPSPPGHLAPPRNAAPPASRARITVPAVLAS